MNRIITGDALTGLKNKDKVILDLCGGTGSWSKPYTDAGYDVRLITLPDFNVVTFAEDVIERKRPCPQVYGVLAAPPCEHFSVSGAQYWKAKDADGRTAAALEIVDACLDLVDYLEPHFWALENPIGRLKELRAHRFVDLTGHYEPKLKFDPCDYGDPYTKKTLLWGRFNIPKPNRVEPIRVCGQGSWIQGLGGKSERTKELRSITPPGFARAFFEANR